MGLSLGDVALDALQEATGQQAAPVANIIEFIESSWGLRMRLYPVQRLILKAHYGIPLDDGPENLTESVLSTLPTVRLEMMAKVENPHLREKEFFDEDEDEVADDEDPDAEEEYTEEQYRLDLINTILRRQIQVTDFRRHPMPGVDEWMTEAEYLRYLYSKGRCNIKEVVAGEQRREMILSIGRRSGKTTISACIAAYETYCLLSKKNPQAYFGLPDGNTIQLISVATDKEQAGLLYRDVAKFFAKCEFFRQYEANKTQSFARFQTPADIDLYGRYSDNQNSSSASINVTFRSCIAKGLRGAGNIVVILDEVAHFTDGGQSSAESVYKAVKPSTMAFSPKDPLDHRVPIGPVEGRTILISSPLGQQGLFYQQFQLAMKASFASADMLAIEAPTWEVNPTVPAGDLEKEYIKDARAFFTEYGGRFSARTLKWIEDRGDLLACVDKERHPRGRGLPKQPHFMGIDVGLVKDGTAIAIGHLEDDQIILDYIDQIKAGEGDYESFERLEFDDVAQWIFDLSRKFYLAEGMFDQWAGIPLEQALLKKGLKQLKSEHFTETLNSQVYRNFKDMMWDKRLALYDYTEAQVRALKEQDEKSPDHMPYIEELFDLQATYKTKYLVKVEAPKTVGKHDDLSDALVRMVWTASQHLRNPKYIAGQARAIKGLPSPFRLSAAAQRKARLQAKAGGSHESRQIRRVKGRVMPARSGRLKG